MAEQPKPTVERFTMLEPRGPNILPPGSEAWPVVEPHIQERFTMLEAKGPNNPSPEELATRVVEPLINGCPVRSVSAPVVPVAVQTLLTQLAAAIEPLDAPARAAALRSVTELARRLAG
jgi:hypothetical protein